MWKEKIFNRSILQEIVMVHDDWMDKSVLGKKDKEKWEELMCKWADKDLETLYLKDIKDFHGTISCEFKHKVDFHNNVCEILNVMVEEDPVPFLIYSIDEYSK